MLSTLFEEMAGFAIGQTFCGWMLRDEMVEKYDPCHISEARPCLKL